MLYNGIEIKHKEEYYAEIDGVVLTAKTEELIKAKIDEHLNHLKWVEHMKKTEEEQKKKEAEEKERQRELKEIPDFKVRLAEVSYVKDNLKLVGNVVNEARLYFLKDRVRICEMDPANVCMVQFELLSSACIDYDVPKEFVMGINVSNVNQVLKNGKSEDIVTFSKKKRGEENDLLITLRGKSKRDYTLCCVDIENREKRVPELTFAGSVSMPSKMICDNINESSTVVESVKFEIDKSFKIDAEGDLAKLSIEHKPDEDIVLKADKKGVSKYSIEYLKHIAESYKVSDRVKLEMATDYPLKATYGEMDKFSLVWILAPRCEA